ncbi:MAG TPA: NAD-dependent epimerase/dehydratase family protein [Baekduia sp.]|uniref:NAD-dependent epimerase/dehydratase family protein n=1 Tax=Baekduia sp. TaxID=2600305 RepID=UPI002C7F4ACB|nr:NAD-dependent epimerase/dehydratase family protein [Baekduia sp.]HMJ36865.1 NAD-dependent epimerase/dehydratase family protein [Baekduia sp.]
MPLPAKIGVTGAAGFIGSNLVSRLLADGCSVVGVDDLSAGTLRNLFDCVDNSSFVLHQFDCCDAQRLRSAFDDCDLIVHLAALKIPRYGGALKTLEVNVKGSEAVFEVALATGARVVQASTSDVYGNAVAPFHEDDPIVLGPPTSRRWSYATSKLMDEHLALRLFEERDLQVTVLRFFNAYGVRNHATWWGGPMSPFIENLLEGRMMELHGDGRQVRTFTYVTDTVDGLVRAIATPESAGEIINIGGDDPISIIKLAEAVQAALDIPGPLRATLLPLDQIGGKYQDVRVRIPDTEKAARLLGFRATVGLEEGLRETIAWHMTLRAERVPEAAGAA